jgi:toxin ParE1/3/4
MSAKLRELCLRPLAEADLEQIWLYSLERWSMKQADLYVSNLIAAMGELARGSKAGRECNVRDGYFQYAVGSHLIFYRVTNAALDVVRILHQRMDVERHL